MPAFEACVAMGYRYLETDVRVTADGVPVVFHDPSLDRVTDSSGRVDQLTWAQLAPARIGGREPILRLEELLGRRVLSARWRRPSVEAVTGPPAAGATGAALRALGDVLADPVRWAA